MANIRRTWLTYQSKYQVNKQGFDNTIIDTTFTEAQSRSYDDGTYQIYYPKTHAIIRYLYKTKVIFTHPRCMSYILCSLAPLRRSCTLSAFAYSYCRFCTLHV